MLWNYRVLAYPDGQEVFFQIHEVYYDENKVPNGATEKGIKVNGSSLEEIEEDLKRMKECLTKPVLWGDERFPQEYKP